MKVLTVNWDPLSDETKVSFTDGFINCDSIEKIDVLMDIIVLLQKQLQVVHQVNKINYELKRLNKAVENNGEEL